MSDISKQTNKQNILLNKLLNKYDKRYVIRSFSVRQEDLPTLILFEELVQREGGKRKFSGLVMNAIQEYVRRHHPGNPQLPLTKFTKPVMRVRIPGEAPKKVEIDYSKMADEELQRRFRWAKNMVTKWLIRKELEKRGHLM